VRIVDAAAQMRAGGLSPVELAEAALHQAAQVSHLNAMAHLDVETVLRAAAERAAELRAGRLRGPLHGIPVTVKEAFGVTGVRTRGGSRAALPEFATGDAAAVARLRAAGAVVIGTTNMVELALGIHSENPWTGDVHNPSDSDRQAGGSSSGSAVAVATGIGLASLGTDTGGSVRIPAALCGVVGLKPSRGRVPTAGVLPLSPTCDHVGPLVGCVADLWPVLDALTEEQAPPLDPRSLRPPRFGVPARFLEGALAVDVRRAFERLLARLRESGAEVVAADPNGLRRAAAAYTPLVRAEGAEIHRELLATQPEALSPRVREPLLAGCQVSAVDYLRARRVRRLARDGIAVALRTVDLLLAPTNPAPAPLLGATEVELESGPAPFRDAFLHLTAPFSFTGVPVVSLPYDRIDGLPVGVQVIGGAGDDHRVMAAAAWLERVVADPA
jgi:aspartyl-tRNA(Asn)/glutamyl-tRNA(Gln) amidotransferase subunit A